MTKDKVTSNIYQTTFVLVGKYEPAYRYFNWAWGFELEGIYTWNDSTYKDNLMDYLDSKVIDRLIEDVCNKCEQGAF